MYIHIVIGYVMVGGNKMATIKDVAKLAGVSTATVSRVINGKGEAAPETIEKIQKIVEELNYKPSSVAKSLSKRESNLIALLIPNLDNPFFSELVRTIEIAANKKGYQIYLCNSEDNREKVEYYLEAMADNYVMGAIINSLHVKEDDLERLEANGISTITIDRAQFSHAYSALAVDHIHGGYLATKHLIEVGGAKKIVFLSGPQDESSSQDRYQGYLRAVGEMDAEHIVKLYGAFDIQSGYETSYAYLANHPNIDGIVCSNDAMAYGVIRACADLGINIPQDIKVIGYDNTVNGKYSVPRLSTVSQFQPKLGDLIINELERVEKKNCKPKKYEVEPELVVRETTQKEKEIC